MKYKNRLKTLATRRAFYDKMPSKDQAAKTRPGSQKK